MDKKKINLTAGIFVALLLAIVLTTTAAIYKSPSEISSGTSGNYTINLANGGNILEDEGFLFFTLPESKGLYRINTDKMSKPEKISENGNGYLQVISNTYYFADGDRLIGCDWDGKRQKVIIDYAKRPLVAGSLVFYLDKNGSLVKYSIQNDTKKIIIDSKKRKVREFIIYYKRIYYTDEQGNIRKVSFDGSNDDIFISTNAKKLSIDGQYIFYIENETLFSAMLKDDKIQKKSIIKADEYAVYGAALFYTYKGNVKFANINKIVSGESIDGDIILKGNAKNISIGEESFYFFSEDNKLKRVSHEGKKLMDLN